MDKINIKARIKRNKLDVLAGDNFRNGDSEIVNKLKKEGKDAIVGISKNDEIYTIIGKDKIYYKNNVEGEINHECILNMLQRNALQIGKNGNFEFLKIDETNAVWLMNVQVMNAMWNIILLLHDNN